MNSSISNSNIISLLLIAAATLLLGFVTVAFALDTLVLYQTNAKNFTQSIPSKHKHLELLDKDFDIIFIGNSHVAYHISTDIFADNSMQIYNYGVPGSEIFNYLDIAKRSKETKADKIIIGMKPDSLFGETSFTSKGISWADLQNIWQIDFSITKKLAATLLFTENFNAIRRYADPIHARIKTLYKNFNPKETIKAASKTVIKPDCNHFKNTNIGEGVTSYSCKNGDLILIGRTKMNEGQENVLELSTPNMQAIQHLNAISEELEESNVQMSVLLFPDPLKTYEFDSIVIQNALKAQLIDTSDIDIPTEEWADNSHLNHKGRITYSQKLVKILSDL